jgi:hypothetical protein
MVLPPNISFSRIIADSGNLFNQKKETCPGALSFFPRHGIKILVGFGPAAWKMKRLRGGKHPKGVCT